MKNSFSFGGDDINVHSLHVFISGMNFLFGSNVKINKNLSIISHVFDVLGESFIDVKSSLSGLCDPLFAVSVAVESNFLSFCDQFLDNLIICFTLVKSIDDNLNSFGHGGSNDGHWEAYILR